MRPLFPLLAVLVPIPPLAAGLELADPEPIVLKTPSNDFSAMTAGDGGRLAVNGDKEIWIWGPGPGKIEKVLTQASFGVEHLGFARDGSLAASEGPVLKSKKRLRFLLDTQALVWDLAKGKRPERIEGVNTAVLSPDGATLALYQGGIYADDSVRLRDVKTGRTKTVWEGPGRCKETGSGFQPYHCLGVTAVAFSPDGARLLITRRRDRDDRESGDSVVIVDAHSGETLRSYSDCDEHVSGEDGKWTGPGYAAFSRDGRFIAYGGNSGYVGPYCGVVVREADTGVLMWRSTQPARGLAFTPDGSTLLAIEASTKHDPGPLIGWDAASGRRAVVPEEPKVRRFAVAPDGSFLFVGPAQEAAEIRAYRLAGAPSAAALPAPEPKPVALESVDAPPAVKAFADPDALAVVIGVEKYRESGIPAVEYAASDAKAMHAYLTRAMGFDEKNVILLTNERATKSDLEKYLGPWLENRATSKSRVFVYFAGHGSPDPKTGDAYLMPYEGDPTYTKSSGYPLKSLYATLAALPTKNVTVALDSCFSGAGQRSVIAAGARPLVNVKVAAPEGAAVVLAAAAGDQISGSYPEGRHGLMTYFLLKGLRGAADEDKDGAVTTRELFAFVRPNVEREARKANREQTPLLQGLSAADAGPVWIRLR